MYIMIKEDVPSNMVPVICSHASLSAYLKYKDDSDVIDWLRMSFKKVICKVNNEEFELLKEIDRIHIITESSLNNNEVAIVVMPRQLKDFPNLVRFAELYK